MNNFERKMSEQLALITTLVFDINRLTTDFNAEIEYNGRRNSLCVRFNEIPVKPFPKMLGNVCVCYILRLETYLEKFCQNHPFDDCCTTDYIVNILQQTRLALIKGRISENTATDTKHTASTGMDERSRVDCSFQPKPAQICDGSPIRAGWQS